MQIHDELIPKANKCPPSSPDGSDAAASTNKDTIELKVQAFEETFKFMKNKRTKEKGYVSSHYMAPKGSLECFP